MKTLSITRRVFLVAQPDSEVFVTDTQYNAIKGRCTVLTPQQGDPAKKVKITKRVALSALPGSVVIVSDKQYKRVKEASTIAYKVTYKYTGTVPSGAPDVPTAAYYAPGATVTVAAAPTLSGYTFSGWSETGTFTMPSEDVEITGSWSEASHNVTYSWKTSGGSYVPSGADQYLPATQSYPVGATVPVSPTPVSGQKYESLKAKFNGWKKGSSAAGTSFTMPNYDVSIVGSWEKLYTVEYKGSRDGDTPPGFVPPATEYVELEGTFIPATVNPESIEPYSFSEWQDEGGNSYMPGEIATLYGGYGGDLILYGVFKQPE